ncbi:MAG TPA: HlyD family efflux transporter periplasmic adaptor subunit [Gemmatimonadales bacterium]|nr:HlyD family efflux transporter periplasmic adaptor subunit [Gemmatimonadales bacterium]
MDIPREPPRKGRKRLIYGGAIIGAIALVTIALGQLEPAAPTVERGSVWFDTVQRGPMLRQVRGPGTLVPEQVRWVSALTQGRVERILVEPGEEVTEQTILLELSNPDQQLRALNADQQLAAAEAQLVNLRSTLQSQLLAQEATVAQTRADFREAERQAASSVDLAAKGLIAQNEVARARDNVEALKKRLEIEEQRLEVLRGSMTEQIPVQEAQVQRLKEVVRFEQFMLASMRVRAGARGVLRDLPLEEGQWVTPGTRLARVVQPGRLKAELRIPETQVRDVAIGQVATIDTRTDTIVGRVVRIDPAAENGSVTVDVALEGPLPRGARPDLSVDGTIELERLDDVLFVGRPAYGQANSVVGLFKVDPDENGATRVSVRLGRSSVNVIEIVEGLSEGDVVILSDMSRWDAVDRVRIK